MEEQKTFKHSNGYSAVLYGKSSMIIRRPDGSEMIHTGSRNVNKEAEVMDLLEKVVEFDKNKDELIEELGENK